MNQFNSLPVLIIGFNRPNLLLDVIRNLSNLKPATILVSIDGPRINNPQDILLVNECRNNVSLINWECKLFTNFSEVNHGSGLWPYLSIDWAFSHVSKLLIMEDDVNISDTFYYAADKMLNLFEENKLIFSINASNISDFEGKEKSDGYSLTKYFSGWGWATWSDRWNLYEYKSPWKKQINFFDCLLKNNFNLIVAIYFYLNIKLSMLNIIKAWDYQVNNLLFKTNLKIIKFNKNLSTNFGVGTNASHTSFLPQIELNHLNLDLIKENDKSEQIYRDKQWRKQRIKIILYSLIKKSFLS